MAAGHDAQAAGERVETLLAELRSHAGPQVAATAEELGTCLVGLYGAGLARIVAIVGADEDDGSGPRLMAKLAADPLVESLLLVHDLHPVDASTRIRRAIEQVLPQLGAHAGEIEYHALDEAGVVHLRLERSGHGCQSGAGAFRRFSTPPAGFSRPGFHPPATPGQESPPPGQESPSPDRAAQLAP